MDDTLQMVPQVPADDQVVEQPTSQTPNLDNQGAVEEIKLTSGDRQYDEEIKSDKIETPRKTFFLDLKANSLGRYVKISERSSGKRSTIIIPEETVGEFIQKIQKLFS